MVAELLDHVLADGSTRSIQASGVKEVSVDVPSRVGRFDVGEEIGRGGFGVVYRAFDTVLQRDVALKAIARRSSESIDEASRLREARATANMNHPYLVPLYEVIEDTTCIYLVSEFCPGQTLTDLLREHPEGISPKWAAEIASKLAAAVAHAHRRGFVHRDIKPSNVLLVPDPEYVDGMNDVGSPRRNPMARIGPLPFTPRLTDFGLVRDIMDSIQSRERGKIVGTLSYIAPEQLLAERVSDGASLELRLGDIYSLGVVIYQMLSGSVPFRSSSPIQLIELMTSSDPPPLRTTHRGVDRDLEAICLQCLQHDPDHRYASVQALCDDLDRYREGFPVHARPQSRRERIRAFVLRSPIESGLVSALVILCIVAAIAFAWSNQSLRRQSQLLANAVETAEASENRAVVARNATERALADAQFQRRQTSLSEQKALGIAYRSDVSQAFAALANKDFATATSIIEDIENYAGETWCSRLDFRLLRSLAHEGWRQIEGYALPIEELAFFPKSEQFATAGGSHFIRIHDASQGDVVREVSVDPDSHVTSLAISHDESMMAVGVSKSVPPLLSWWPVNGDYVSVINLDGLDVTNRLSGFQTTIDSLAFLSKSQELAVGTRYEPIQVFSFDSNRLLRTYASERRNEDLFVAPDNKLMWISSHASIANNPVKTDQNFPLKRMGMCSDGRWLAATVHGQNDVILWDLSKEPRRRILLENPYGIPTTVRVSPHGKHVVTGTMGGGIVGWEIPDSISVHSESVLQPIDNLKPKRHQILHDTHVSAIAVNDQGLRISGDNNGTIVMSGLDTADSVRQEHRMRDSSFSVDMSSNGEFAIIGMVDGSVWRLDLRSQEAHKLCDLGTTRITQVALSNDNTLVAVGDRDGRILLADLSCMNAGSAGKDGSAGWVELHHPDRAELPTASVEELRFSDDSSQLIARCGVTFLLRIDIKSLSTLQRFHLPTSMQAVCLLNSKTVLTVGDFVYRMSADGLDRSPSDPMLHTVRCLCRHVSADKIFIGCADGKIRTVDAQGHLLDTSRSWSPLISDPHMDRSITAIECSSDGRNLFTGSHFGDVAIWDAETLRFLGTLWAPDSNGEIESIRVSNDGQTILAHQRILTLPNGVSDGVIRWIRIRR